MENLRRLRERTLDSALGRKEMRTQPMCVFSRWFIARYTNDLSLEEKAQVQVWTSQICEGLQRAVDAFLAMLKRRKSDLVATGASTIGDLFQRHAKKYDVDIRAGYDFLRRDFGLLTETQKQEVHAAVQPLLRKGKQLPAKRACDPKLHGAETPLGDGLPRPRMPKSLRQLYGNSGDAESRIMPFFQRVHKVDVYMQQLRFEDCDYCKEFQIS